MGVGTGKADGRRQQGSLFEYLELLCECGGGGVVVVGGRGRCVREGLEHVCRQQHGESDQDRPQDLMMQEAEV